MQGDDDIGDDTTAYGGQFTSRVVGRAFWEHVTQGKSMSLLNIPVPSPDTCDLNLDKFYVKY